MAEFEGEKFSSYLKKLIFEHIENEYDLKIYKEAKAEFEKNPKIYSHEEVKRELGL